MVTLNRRSPGDGPLRINSPERVLIGAAKRYDHLADFSNQAHGCPTLRHAQCRVKAHRSEHVRRITPVPQNLAFRLLCDLNGLVCRMLYHVGHAGPSPIPSNGAALLVCDHTSYSDAMALLATTGRPVIFVVTREVYELPSVRWVLQAAHCIPVRRGAVDVVAGRRMLRTLYSGEVLGIFPEGGIDECRMKSGYPGVGYLALKTGA